MISNKDFIIQGIECMDIQLLQKHLDEEKTYQNLSKEKFLKKLGDAFEEFKSSGDVFLKSYSGYCNASDCKKGSEGLAFIGNKSGKQLDLIIEASDTEVNDIYYCDNFNIHQQDPQKNDCMKPKMSLDDLVSLKLKGGSSPQLNEGIEALEALDKYKGEIIDKTVYLPWVEKYAALYASIEDPFFIEKELRDFSILHYRLSELKEYLENFEASQQAINSFDELDLADESQLLKWLVNNEETGHNLTLFLFDEIDFEQPQNTPYFTVQEVKINTADLYPIIRFKDLFDRYYWEQLEKYTTFSDEQTMQYINSNNEMAKNISSLKYHLEKRKIPL